MLVSYVTVLWLDRSAFLLISSWLLSVSFLAVFGFVESARPAAYMA
jgi:hypothetical protein